MPKKNFQNSPPEPRLYADSSGNAKLLEEKLRQKGYAINKILSGSNDPMFTDGSIYVWGYENIYRRLALV